MIDLLAICLVPRSGGLLTGKSFFQLEEATGLTDFFPLAILCLLKKKRKIGKKKISFKKYPGK